MVGGTRNPRILISGCKTPFRALLYFITSFFLLVYFDLHGPSPQVGYNMVDWYK